MTGFSTLGLFWMELIGFPGRDGKGLRFLLWRCGVYTVPEGLVLDSLGKENRDVELTGGGDMGKGVGSKRREGGGRFALGFSVVVFFCLFALVWMRKSSPPDGPEAALLSVFYRLDEEIGARKACFSFSFFLFLIRRHSFIVMIIALLCFVLLSDYEYLGSLARGS